MRADLATDPIALKLALTAYLLSLAVFIPVSGWVADRFGARPTFMWAIAVFLLGDFETDSSHLHESGVRLSHLALRPVAALRLFCHRFTCPAWLRK